MKKFSLISIFLAVAISLTACFVGCNGNPKSLVEGKKIAYIMQMSKSDIFEAWSDSAKETAEALGMTFDEYFCNGDDDLWKEKVSYYAQNGYDGLLLSHGGSSYAYSFLSQIKQDYPSLKIVTFDTEFLDGGVAKKIDGVTQFFQQDDKLAELSLDYICETLYPAKQTVNVLKIWKDDYISAFERREVGYAKYVNEGKINTVQTIAPVDLSDVENSIKTQVLQVLSNASDGEIDAIWCCYDLYANGAYAALVEAGKTNIPLVSVDICNADIQKMASANSPWKACATTNWKRNGEFGVRILALEMTNEYSKIKNPATGNVDSWLELPASLITQDMVSGGNVNINDLHTVAGADYSARDFMPTSDWMKAILG